MAVNNPTAALEHARVAEAGIEHLDPDLHTDLLQYMAELYRRLDDRDRSHINAERLAVW